MTAHRLMLTADRDFVVSGWSASYRLSDRAGMIAMEDWASVMHAQIAKVIDRPSASTVVAFDEDSGVLQGFICADRNPGLPYGFETGIPPGLPIVFYMFVKEAYRRNGIGRGLFGAVAIDPLSPFTFACRTALVGWMRSKIPSAKHDHLRARYPETP